PIGFEYESLPGKSPGPDAITLPLAGRIILGEAVSNGASWHARATPILLSGSIVRRVTPWWSTDEATRVGDPETLDEGSILDSHACLQREPATETPAPTCSPEEAIPAVGFFRTGDGLRVQLYARGPAAVQNYRGPVRRIDVPESTAAWQSD